MSTTNRSISIFGLIPAEPTIGYQSRPAKELEIIQLMAKASKCKGFSVVWGAGSNGKSAMLAYLIRHWQENKQVPNNMKLLFKSVLWLSLGDFRKTAFQAEDFYLFVAKQLGIMIDAAASGRVLFETLKSHLKRHQPMLIVADDVYDDAIWMLLDNLEVSRGLCIIVSKIPEIVNQLASNNNVFRLEKPVESFTPVFQRNLNVDDYSWPLPVDSSRDEMIAEACCGQPIIIDSCTHRKLGQRHKKLIDTKHDASFDDDCSYCFSHKGLLSSFCLSDLSDLKHQLGVTLKIFSSYLVLAECNPFSVDKISVAWNIISQHDEHHLSAIGKQLRIHGLSLFEPDCPIDRIELVEESPSAANVNLGENLLHVAIRLGLDELLQHLVDNVPHETFVGLCQQREVQRHRTPLEYLFWTNQLNRSKWSWRILLAICSRLPSKILRGVNLLNNFFENDKSLTKSSEYKYETDFEGFQLLEIAEIEGFVIDVTAEPEKPAVRRSKAQDKVETIARRLYVAARAGDIDTIRGELDSRRKVVVDKKLDRGFTMLHVAAMTGNVELAEMLLRTYNANVNVRDDRVGATPLHLAALFEQKEVAKLLLAIPGIEVNAADKSGQTPLHRSAAAGNQGESVMRLLLEMPDIEINAKDKNGSTPLHWAARTGSEFATKLLLDKPGINFNAKDNDGVTPLHWAARLKSCDATVLKLLLQLPEIEVNARSNNGSTPLHWAAQNGQEAASKLLIDLPGVEVNAKDKSGQTPLHRAAKNGRASVTKVLLFSTNFSKKIEINAKNNGGLTPLHCAARWQREAVAQLLLEMPGIELNAKANNGETPLQVAARYGSESVLKMLLKMPRIELSSTNRDSSSSSTFVANLDDTSASSTPVHLKSWKQLFRYRDMES